MLGVLRVVCLVIAAGLVLVIGTIPWERFGIQFTHGTPLEGWIAVPFAWAFVWWIVLSDGNRVIADPDFLAVRSANMTHRFAWRHVVRVDAVETGLVVVTTDGSSTRLDLVERTVPARVGAPISPMVEVAEHVGHVQNAVTGTASSLTEEFTVRRFDVSAGTWVVIGGMLVVLAAIPTGLMLADA
jgi:hypothetical protein